MAATKKADIDKLRDLADQERMSARAEDLLATYDVRELAEVLTTLADAQEEACNAVDSWQWAEGGEEKADARMEAIDALTAFIEAWDEATNQAPPSELMEAWG